ncbi:MAG: hypothetical protein XD50_1420 [Clostridia bacterium 41_269]|nr:MAG: hypothetical protein XD50_1420 [Clostridia bacterium 41_269]
MVNQCEFCGEKNAKRVCTLVFADENYPQEYCWLICEKCKREMKLKTMKVLVEKAG